MCGIAGLISSEGAEVKTVLLEKMNSFLRERGPDMEGYWVKDNVGFAHSRLSIIDLSDAGKQPMLDKQQKVVITFNGEIYNYPALKKELINLGHTFISNTDTEVLINGYLEWGISQLLEKIDGMFAFALYDLQKQLLYLCRDRFGKKPLYYFNNRKKILFSSDIRSIHAVESLTLDYEALDYYLTELSTPQPKTIWKEVSQVKPAHFIEFDINKGTHHEQAYWKLHSQVRHNMSLEEAISEVEEKLKEAIIKRTIGDVPIGTFLSSGIDSGLITAILALNSSHKIKTFTVGTTDSDLNELPEARKLAERYETDHTEIIAEPNFLEELPQLIEYYGEPFADSSMLPTYYICKKISRHIKVALSGDGGDETFGGYFNYAWAAGADEWLKKHNTGFKRLIGKSTDRAKSLIGATTANYAHLDDYAQQPGYIKLYREMGFHPDSKKLLYREEFYNGFSCFTARYLQALWDKNRNENITNTLFKSSFNTRLLNDYLVKVDRASMKNSMEVRSPFLDHKLVELSGSIPNELKFYEGETKFILKKIAQKYIHKSIFNRKKKGFGIPLSNWLRNENKNLVTDLLFSEAFRNRKIFNTSYIEKIVNDHISKKADHTDRIWSLICLELWFQKFVD